MRRHNCTAVLAWLAARDALRVRDIPFMAQCASKLISRVVPKVVQKLISKLVFKTSCFSAEVDVLQDLRLATS